MNIVPLGNSNNKYEKKIILPHNQKKEEQIVVPVRKNKILKSGLLGLSLLSLAGTVTPQIINVRPAQAVEVTNSKILLAKLSPQDLQKTNTQSTQNHDFSYPDSLKSFKDLHAKDSKSLVYKGWTGKSILSPEDAAKYLKDGYKIHVKNSLGDFDEITNLHDLQIMDSIKGAKIAPLISDFQAKALISLEKGTDSENGIFTTGRGLFKTSYKISAFQAYNIFKNNSETELNVKLGGDNDNLVYNLDDLAAFYVLQGGGWNEEFFSQDLQHALLSYNNVNINSQNGTSYDLYKHLQNGGSVSIQGGGKYNSINSFDDLKKLDILYTGGKNTILPQDQLDTLKYLADSQLLRDTGLYLNGTKLNSYDALQLLQKGKQSNFSFAGGDFDERLSIPVNQFNNLLETKTKFENQKEYDKYQYSSEEFKNKLSPWINKLFPSIVEQTQTVSGKLEEANNNIIISSALMGSAVDSLKDMDNNTESVIDNSINNIKTALEKVQNAANAAYYPASRIADWLALARYNSSLAEEKMSDIKSSLSNLSNKLKQLDSQSSHTSNSNNSTSRTDNKIDNILDNSGSHRREGSTDAKIDDILDNTNSNTSHSSTDDKIDNILDTSGGNAYGPARTKINNAINDARKFIDVIDSLLVNINTMENSASIYMSKIKNINDSSSDAVNAVSNAKIYLADTVKNIAKGKEASLLAKNTFSQQDNSVKKYLSDAKNSYKKMKFKENTDLNETEVGGTVQDIRNTKTAIANTDFHRNTIGNHIDNVGSSVKRVNNEFNNMGEYVNDGMKNSVDVINNIDWFAKGASNSAGINLGYAKDYIRDIEKSLRDAKEHISDRSLKEDLSAIEKGLDKIYNLIDNAYGNITNNAIEMTDIENKIDKVHSALDVTDKVVDSSRNTFAKTSNAVSKANNTVKDAKEKAASAINILTNTDNLVTALPSLVNTANNAKNNFKNLTTANSSLSSLNDNLQTLNDISSGELKNTTAKGLKLIKNMETRTPRPDGWTPPQPRVNN